jgi:hypothetical protein
MNKASSPTQTGGPSAAPKQNDTITLPADAQKIEECSAHKGALYVRSQDIPTGPIYMVHDSKVIGLEYMIPKEKILADSNLDFLASNNIKVDHIDIGPVPNGHLGMTKPHYHVDLFTIDKDKQMNITCPNTGKTMQMDTISPSVSPSSPSGTMQMKNM